MGHKHEFKKRVVTFHSCDCGADGQKCEACGKLTDLDVMRGDSEGRWFCPGCWDDEAGGRFLKETP